MYAPENFWVSKIGDYQRCSRLYKLKHLDGEKEPGLPSGDLIFGTAMHSAANAVLSGEDGVLTFETYWNSLNENEHEWGRSNYADLASIGVTLIGRFARLHAKKFKPFQMEQRLYAELIPGLNVEGTPDYLGDYEGVPSVVDFKTAAYRYDKKKIVCGIQLPFYAKLAKLATGYEAKQAVYVVFIKSKTEASIQTVVTQLTESKLNSTVENVVMTCLEARDRKSFPMNNSSCLMGQYACSFFNRCHGSSE